MDDLDLAKGLAAGDDQAFDLLLVRHHTALYRFLRHLTRHAEDAEDLAQNAIMRAVKCSGRFDGRASFRSWLLAIGYREFLRWRRRRLWLPITADRPQPGNDYERLIEAETLLAALGRLPAEMRAVFLMYNVETLSVAEIAAALSIPEGTVKSRLHNARARLSSMLGEEVTYATKPSQP